MSKRNKRYTTNEYIEKANEVHNNKYTYDNTVYVRAHDKVIITCPIHGNFKQVPADHLQGHGCPSCKSQKQSERQYSTTEAFVEKANIVHNYVYDYSKVNYVSSKKPVCIVCPLHGEFWQIPSSHLAGKGCNICGNLRAGCWTDTEWEEKGQISTQFSGYQVYVVECWNENEHFIKIGKTYTDINVRLKQLPYDFRIYAQEYGSAKYISLLERHLHKTYQYSVYIPTIPFGGMYECYIPQIQDSIINTIQDYSNATITTNNSDIQVD